jgi:hypothetical protein
MIQPVDSNVELSAWRLNERLYGQTVNSTGWNDSWMNVHLTVNSTVGSTIGLTVERTPINVTINDLLCPWLFINQNQMIKISKCRIQISWQENLTCRDYIQWFYSLIGDHICIVSWFNMEWPHPQHIIQY